MNQTSLKMFLRKSLIFLLSLSATVVILQSCYPYDDQSPANSDVVATFYDDATNFSALKYYAFPDTIYTFDDNGNIVPDDDISLTNANQIKNSINNNMQEMGFTKITGNGNITNADSIVHVFALVTSSTWVSGGCYGGYWSYWYPYYGWCYPTYYTYTTGSIIIPMLNPDKTGDDQKVWFAGINGVVSGSSSSNASRINSDIDQAFNQSSYLRGSK